MGKMCEVQTHSHIHSIFYAENVSVGNVSRDENKSEKNIHWWRKYVKSEMERWRE